MALNEYQPDTTFPGVIGRTTDEPSPTWPPPIRVLPGAPKLLMTVLDDTCFGQLRCDGSPIPPPNLDATVEDHRRLMEGQGIGGPGIAGGRW